MSNHDFLQLNGKTISFIGGGNMARAIIDGLLKAKREHNLSLNLCVSNRSPEKLVAFAEKGVTTATPDTAADIVKNADVVVLAVKPQMMREACLPLAELLSTQTVLSVAAGLSVDTLSDMLGGYQKIVRCMPNLPSSVGLGASGMYAKAVDDEVRQLTDAIMKTSGITAWVDDENLLHAVTAVAGSAPAYFFYVLENMIAKAVEMGLSADDAHALAVQSLAGAGELARHQNPAVLREQVTSKGGTTAAALGSLYDNQVGQAFAQAMQACSDRSVELGVILSQS